MDRYPCSSFTRNKPPVLVCQIGCQPLHKCTLPTPKRVPFNSRPCTGRGMSCLDDPCARSDAVLKARRDDLARGCRPCARSGPHAHFRSCKKRRFSPSNEKDDTSMQFSGNDCKSRMKQSCRRGAQSHRRKLPVYCAGLCETGAVLAVAAEMDKAVSRPRWGRWR